ncbi:MAG TPA: helix-turn-helix transcriptional regulator [Puia sp.]|nr:helix-turn-helix transcriptional regulator [Puia sp.]
MTTAEKEILKKRFGAIIQQIRQKKRLSLRQVAANCNLDNSKIAKIEDGQFNISLSTIVELARGLEVHPSKLFVGEFNWFGLM